MHAPLEPELHEYRIDELPVGLAPTIAIDQDDRQVETRVKGAGHVQCRPNAPSGLSTGECLSPDLSRRIDRDGVPRIRRGARRRDRAVQTVAELNVRQTTAQRNLKRALEGAAGG